eukprot:CAMPEP_0119062322 /NCGR_PEP_ID=MMETSP1178-20130426/5934_1 /TAXON_ID=33656 /ORGANISM="unid sp, Strain CCMP2000" /LENGTH=116 /DNA_ID=CAMNT_0007043593 /DNA_START=38 /DNA_END=385 /DNA_ORIENTATION=+
MSMNTPIAPVDATRGLSDSRTTTLPKYGHTTSAGCEPRPEFGYSSPNPVGAKSCNANISSTQKAQLNMRVVIAAQHAPHRMESTTARGAAASVSVEGAMKAPPAVAELLMAAAVAA